MAEVDKSIISLSNALQSRVENGYLKSPFVLDLKKSLEKLINPFVESLDFSIEIICERETCTFFIIGVVVVLLLLLS